jgi:hypothetical protein
MEISNQLRARCCGRVAQYQLHIASNKNMVSSLKKTNCTPQQATDFEPIFVGHHLGHLSLKEQVDWIEAKCSVG